jgi:hypothetical protein
MGDGQAWLFPPLPSRGVDSEFDALIQGLYEAEDQSEARRFELAIAILLLWRMYQPSPSEYQAIFGFGSDYTTESSAQEAISTMITSQLDSERRAAACHRCG